jgi:hypothetical protein
MKKIRCFLAIMALLAALSGFSLQGSGAMANAVSSGHASSVSVPAVAGKSVALRIYGQCPGATSNDC